MDTVTVANVTYYAAAGALLAALAAFLAFTPGGTPARRALAAMVALSSCASFASAHATATLWPGAFGALADIGLVSTLAALAFFALFPRPVPLRRAHGVGFALAAAVVVATALVWIFARGAVLGAPEPRLTLAWHWLGPYGEAIGVLGGLAILSALVRIRELPPDERRGAIVLASGVALPVWLAPGAIGAAWAVARASGAAYAPSALQTIPGDTLGATAWLWSAAWLGVPIAAILYALFALRTRLPLAFALLGVVLGALGATTSLAVAWTGAILTVAIPPYAMARYGVLGGATAPRWAAALLAASVTLGVFLLVNALALSLAPENPLVLAVGVLVGLVAAGATLALVLPRARGALASLTAAPEDTRARLEPYRAILAREREAGTPRDALVERLRGIRASLGVTDHEHAVMEHALFGDSAARRGHGVAEGRVVLGRYRVERTLAEGGAGVTYLCSDERLGRTVVIKALRGRADDALDAVLHEARAMSRVRDARVVTLLDVERVGDEAYLVMEHMEGGSLADRLAKGPLAPSDLRTVGDDLLAALGAIHAAGLVHRDVKPSNVLLTRDGRAKLADFGIAHLPGFETTAAANAGSAAVAGTIRYMSPEHARGRRVDARSDLFSAAATLYEAATGAPYLAAQPGESAVELQLRAAAASPFERPQAAPLPRAFWERALHPVASERFGSAHEMRVALDKSLVGAG
ncbi:MAG TPA: serine/threonine-protein kinase [Candidatus Thermoplasmatota archaeon]|nr:serine/threonine-protein kinase [Candidatus Thermoplasmatota archaeon]